MIKAIIFDVGGTYMAGSVLSFVNQSYKTLGVEKEISDFDEIVFDEKLNAGKISHDDSFRNYFGVPISDEQMDVIKDIWRKAWKPSEKMIELVVSLKKNYTLAILSNSDSINAEEYYRQGWYSYFDPIILSHELGILKPDKKIYTITLDKLQLPVNQCLFIDDQEKALQPAKELGMDTIHFESLLQLQKELTLRGIKY